MTHLATDFVDRCQHPHDDRAAAMVIRNVLRFGASTDGPVKQTPLFRIVLGLLCMLTALFFRQFFKTLSFNRQGLFCDDDSIFLPYKPDTINPTLLETASFTFALIIIIFIELFNAARALQSGILLSRKIVGIYVHPTIFYVVQYYGVYLFGLCVSDALTELGKRTVGRLRPNFVDVCKPNLTLCATNPRGYIPEVQCLGLDGNDIRASFPSGHSSDAFYMAIFCIMYIQARLELRSTLRLVQGLFQVILFTMAYYCALSRVMDHKHRGTDALGGAFLGSLMAASMVILIANNFRHSRYHIRSTTNTDHEALLESGRQSDHRTVIHRQASSLLSAPKQNYGAIAHNEPPSDSGISTI